MVEAWREWNAHDDDDNGSMKTFSHVDPNKTIIHFCNIFLIYHNDMTPCLCMLP